MLWDVAKTWYLPDHYGGIFHQRIGRGTMNGRHIGHSRGLYWPALSRAGRAGCR